MSVAPAATNFEQSYNEVLAFIKHEDDKINRVLTALAFLTVAGVTLFIFSGRRQASAFPDSTIDSASVFFVLFMVEVVLALFSALAALDPTSHRPVFTRVRPKDDERSILFYEHIATEKKWWEEQLSQPPTNLTKTYYDDASRLAARARHKVVRFSQCQAFLQASMVALALLAIARVPAWSSQTRWWVTAALLAIASFVPLYDYVVMRLTSFPGVGKSTVPAVAFVLNAALAAGLVVLAAPLEIRWLAVSYALGWLPFARLLLPLPKSYATWCAFAGTLIGVFLLGGTILIRILT